jgi:2-dehydropantoate 2-reductase
LNALSGRPLREQLADRVWRKLFADQMAEGLAVLKAERITPASATPVPANLLPHLLRLPDFVFSRVLGRTMKIDPAARSSMWEDLQRGRRTEVDYLQGVIVRMAADRRIGVPISQRVVALVKAAEAAGRGAPGLTAEQIRG